MFAAAVMAVSASAQTTQESKFFDKLNKLIVSSSALPEGSGFPSRC